MKKRILAALSAVLLLISSLSVNVYAQEASQDEEESPLTVITKLNGEIPSLQMQFDPAASSETAQALKEELIKLYTERLIATQAFVIEDVQASADLRIEMMQYDIAMQTLKQKTVKYREALEAYEQAEKDYRVGSITAGERTDAKTARNKAKTELLAALQSVSGRKDKIKKMTGEPPADDYDYESLYYVIDPSELTLDSLPQVATPGTICTLAGIGKTDVEIDETVVADALHGVKELYYTLGGYLQDMVGATEKLATAKQDFKVGAITQEQLTIAQRVYDDTRLSVSVAKAEYCKSLIQLDAMLGGVLIVPTTVNGKAAYLDTLPKELMGEGFWQISHTKQGKEFLAYTVPATVAECDTYKIFYGKTELGGAAVGEACLLAEAEYLAKEPQAYVTFYREEEEIISYSLDVFSPMGTFLEIPRESQQS